MPEMLIDLWPNEIATDVLSPTVILKYQAEQLKIRTKGILEAALVTSAGDQEIQHSFQINARTNSYSYVLFIAVHQRNLVYPVTITFDGWHPDQNQRTASSPDELNGMLKNIFQSGRTKSVLFSLLATANEESR